MKAQMIEKNGFPKPIGLLLIFLMISLVCFVQCLFSQTANTKTTGKKFYFPGVEETTEIQVEAWMVNIERFEQELVKSDPEVEIEEWMVNESCWNKGYISEFQAEECEPNINVEAWMVNIERFEQELVKSDPEVEIEAWMLNDSHWLVSTSTYYTQNENEEEEVKIEEWMCDEDYWGDVYYTYKTEEGSKKKRDK